MDSIPKPWTGVAPWRHALAAACGLFLLGASAASWGALRATLDRATAQVGQALTLNIESDGAQAGASPDVTPLRKDFDVLGTSTSSETSIVNGSRSDRTRWLVRLQPRHAGSIDIPPISVGNERTAALTLDVTPASPQAANQASRQVFVEAEAAGGKSVYVQQQIPYTVRVYYDATVQTGDLAAPDPADAIVEQLGVEKHYTEMRNGRQYNVVERRYAIAPEKSGTLHIPPASFHGTALLAQDRNGNGDQGDDLMSRLLRDTPFANDPFFKDSFGAGISLGESPQPVAASGPALTLDVQPRPPGANGNWLPAEQISLHDSWADATPQFKVGEPATRTITIQTQGLAAAQIPQLSLAQPGNARLYPETVDNQSRTDGKTISGTSKQSVTYIPTAPGALEVPPVELAWWNTRSNAQSRAVLPARTFKIEAGAAGERANAAPPAPAAAAPQPISAPVRAGGGALSRSAALSASLHDRRAWFAGAAALALTLLSLIALRPRLRRRFKSSETVARADPAPRRKAALRALQQACEGNDRQAAKAALLSLAWAEWPDDPPRGLGALAARLASGGEEITALDRSLYGADGQLWQGAGLWAAMRGGLQSKRGETWRDDDGLGALYR